MRVLPRDFTGRYRMSVVALVAWIMTAGGGLYLLSIWLIEYDKDFQATAATRLPPLVLACHVLLAAGGLLVWAAYLIFDQDDLSWVAVGALALAAALGVTMAIRWFGVYRAARIGRAVRVAQRLQLVAPGRIAVLEREPDPGPPERNFPLPVVIAHGVFAAATVTLVLLVALGVGGS
jgi:hypothetical protein